MSWYKAFEFSGTTAITVSIAWHVLFIVIAMIHNVSVSQFWIAYQNIALIFWAPIGIIFILYLAIFKYPIKFFFFMFTSFALLLIVASPLETDTSLIANDISSSIRDYIESNFEFSYIIAAVTILAFLFSILTYYAQNKKNNYFDDQLFIHRVLEDQQKISNIQYGYLCYCSL